jgi:hypothetical protein
MTFKERRRVRAITTARGLTAIAAGAGAAVFTLSSLAQTVEQSSGNDQNVIMINGRRVDPIVASGPEKTETRTLETFRSISISLPAEATFTVADKPSVRITTQANVLPVVVTRVENGTLSIGIDGAVTLHQPIRIEIAGPSPEAVTLTGTGHFVATNVASSALALKITGNATMHVTGTVDHVSVSVSGTGMVDTSAIHARSLDADVTGTASMHAFASESAKVHVSGIGKIQIAGQPAQRQVDRTGLATVSFE